MANEVGLTVLWDKGDGPGPKGRALKRPLLPQGLSNRLCTWILSLDPHMTPQVVPGIVPTLQVGD